jgi:hypothetical protein
MSEIFIIFGIISISKHIEQVFYLQNLILLRILQENA